MDYPRIALLGGLTAMALLADYSGFPGKPGSKDWTRWTCDSKAVTEWRHIDGNKNVVNLRPKDEGNMVHHLEQGLATIGAFHSDGRLGFHLKNNEGLAYWVETDDLIGRGCKAH